MDPLVSIIVPVFNAEKYLEQCLDSALGQTLREIEVICVNDGSTDSSPAILERYAAQDSRLRVIHQENAGISAARNAAMEEARGEYVAFLDADDFYLPELCELAYAEAVKHGTDILQFPYFEQRGEKRSVFQKCPTETRVFTELKERYSTPPMLFYTVWTRLYRRAFLEEHQIRFPYGGTYEDNYFSTRTALHAVKIVHFPKPLYVYRIGVGYSTSSKHTLLRMGVIETWRKLLEDVPPDLPKEIREDLVCLKLKNLSRAFRRIAKKSQRKECLRMILAAMTPEDWEFLERPPKPLPWKAALFFDWMRGTRFSLLAFCCWGRSPGIGGSKNS